MTVFNHILFITIQLLWRTVKKYQTTLAKSNFIIECWLGGIAKHC